MVFGCSAVGGFETLQTRRSPSIVWEANISDRCFVDDACHDRFTIGEGARGVVNVWRMVKEGCKATIKMEPFMYLFVGQRPGSTTTENITHPIAYVWQSAAGAKAVIGSKMVRREICSEVEGSNKMTFP